MANSKWMAISYFSLFIFVYFSYLAYAFVPVFYHRITNTTIDLANQANATVSLSTMASGLPTISIMVIIIIIIIIIIAAFIFASFSMYQAT